MAKSDRIRVKGLLTEAIRMLCKSSLPYKSELNIEGLLGITLDNNDVFLVNINESVVLDGKSTPNKVPPPKPAKRPLPILPVQNVPNATSIASLPGTRYDSDYTPAEKRLKEVDNGPDDHNGTNIDDNDSDNTLVDSKSDNDSITNDHSNDQRAKSKDNEISSLDFGDMLARYERDGESLPPGPHFTSDDNLAESVDQKPTLGYNYDYDNNSAEQQTEDDDIVVVKAEMGRQSHLQQYPPQQEPSNYPIDPMSSNLLTHDEYITSVDQPAEYGNSSNISEHHMSLSTPQRRGRGAISNKTRGRGRGGTPTPTKLYDSGHSSAVGNNLKQEYFGDAGYGDGALKVESQYSTGGSTTAYGSSQGYSAASQVYSTGNGSSQGYGSAGGHVQQYGAGVQQSLAASMARGSSRAHQRGGATVPGGELRWTCTHCGRTFCSQTSLKRHIDTVHMKLTLFRCPVCNSTYSRKDVWKSHLKTKHGITKETLQL